MRGECQLQLLQLTEVKRPQAYSGEHHPYRRDVHITNNDGVVRSMIVHVPPKSRAAFHAGARTPSEGAPT